MSNRSSMQTCNYCDRPVHRPVFARKHEESGKYVAYHKNCLEKLARRWEKYNK